MTLEGVLGPNERLDAADALAVDAPDAICVTAGGELLFSSGRALYRLGAWGAEPVLATTLDSRITALCAGPGGMVAAATEGGRIVVMDGGGETASGWSAPDDLVSVSDMAFDASGALLVVDTGCPAGDDFLARATWDESARGRVFALSATGSPRLLASGLHCPMGVAIDRDGKPLVTLLERACVVDLDGRVQQGGYPAYPGRLRRTATGFVMACVSRRDPLIEFLKTEPGFVAEMKASVEPRYWLSPRMTPDFSHDLPIELGASRLFGEIKPWAPSFSYGLVIETDERLLPVGSAHSRANGRRHAISDVTMWNGTLVAVSKASGELLNIGQGGLAA